MNIEAKVLSNALGCIVAYPIISEDTGYLMYVAF
jgi:hypothetical protein